jgi:hypothetical protein
VRIADRFVGRDQMCLSEDLMQNGNAIEPVADEIENYSVLNQQDFAVA